MPELATPHLDALKDRLPDPTRDIRLNVGAVLSGETLDDEQTWGVVLSSAYFLREPRLIEALRADARAAGVREEVLEDAQAAAVIMGMNTVYYRFRHLVGKPSYQKKPARLRMQWMARPRSSKALFELMSIAGAVLAGCEGCVKAHEASILEHGLTEDHVHDAVRIAAVVNATAIALAC